MQLNGLTIQLLVAGRESISDAAIFCNMAALTLSANSSVLLDLDQVEIRHVTGFLAKFGVERLLLYYF